MIPGGFETFRDRLLAIPDPTEVVARDAEKSILMVQSSADFVDVHGRAVPVILILEHLMKVDRAGNRILEALDLRPTSA